MEVLQFPARQSSASPAKEGWVRGELSVMCHDAGL